MSGRLEGKLVLVTGAGSGIGRETARRFAQEGARVAAAGRRLETVQAAVTGLDGAFAVEMDVSASASVTAGLDAAVDGLGGLDIVVNNAGIAPVGTLADLDEAAWDEVVDVNLKSVYLVSHAAWPHLVARGGGAILSTSSICGQVAFQAHVRYCVTKAAVEMMSRCMALDGAPVGIRANCVVPGFTWTPMLEGFLRDQPDPDAANRGVVGKVPAGRLGTPSDIAGAFLYLAADEARWVTGTTLVVDGGTSAGLWEAPAPVS